MKAALSVLVLLCLTALAAAAAGTGPSCGRIGRKCDRVSTGGGGTTNTGGPKCTLPIAVKCAQDPCTVTKCKRNPLFQCLPNYCGGCKTDWRTSEGHSSLLVNTCPPAAPSPSSTQTPPATTFPTPPICPDGKGACPPPITPGGPPLRLRSLQAAAPLKRPLCSLDRVCGEDDVSYQNDCVARANGTDVKYYGTCVFPSACAADNKKYRPVCGNGRTYANACVAKLNGITDYTSGPCIDKCRPSPVRCITPVGCAKSHRCKGNPKYRCTDSDAYCTQHMLDSGAIAKVGICNPPVYVLRSSGFPAAACFP